MRPLSTSALRQRLRDAAIFQTLGESDLERITSYVAYMSVPAGSTLLHVGQVNSQMYILLSGRLRVHLGTPDAAPIAYIEAGETVGELSVIDQTSACAHVVADGDCELIRVDEHGFWDLVAASHNFSVQLMRKLAARLRANNAAVVEVAQDRDEFRQQALLDATTGIHNRRWLDELLPRLVARHLQHGRPLCLSMIDIDHFKRFNDDHGHDVGDAVLKAVATTLHDELRPSDIVARYGGEEFVVIFPDTDLFGARCAAERLRKAVEHSHIAEENSSRWPPVTISIGLSQLDMLAPESLLQASDAALYRAKAGGRNRVECAPAPDGAAPQTPNRSSHVDVAALSPAQD